MAIDIRPMFWRLLVEIPAPKKKSAGGIILTEDTRDAEKAYLCVGKLMAVGELAFKRTVDNSLHFNRQRLPKLGDWLLFARHSGQQIRPSDEETETHFVMLNDTDILGVVGDPEIIKAYV